MAEEGFHADVDGVARRCSRRRSDELNTLVAMVRDTGKSGKITITVEVKPFAKVQDALEVTGNVVATLPREKKSAEVFFPTVENNLSRHSERQTELPGYTRNEWRNGDPTTQIRCERCPLRSAAARCI
jgi:hypothetical protein